MASACRQDLGLSRETGRASGWRCLGRGTVAAERNASGQSELAAEDADLVLKSSRSGSTSFIFQSSLGQAPHVVDVIVTDGPPIGEMLSITSG